MRESETESKESLLYYNAAADVEVLPVTHVPPQPPLLLCRIFTVEEIPPLSVCVCSGVTFLMVFTLDRISLEQLLLFDGDEGEFFKFFFFFVLFLFFFSFPYSFPSNRLPFFPTLRVVGIVGEWGEKIGRATPDFWR